MTPEEALAEALLVLGDEPRMIGVFSDEARRWYAEGWNRLARDIRTALASQDTKPSLTHTGTEAGSGLLSELRTAYTLLISAEPTLIRDAKTGPNETSLHYKALLRDRATEWLDQYRDDFEGGVARLASQDTKPALTHTGAEAQGPDSAAQVAVLREALLDIERWSKPMNPLDRTKPEYRVWRRANEALNTLQEADTASLVQDYNAEVARITQVQIMRHVAEVAHGMEGNRNGTEFQQGVYEGLQIALVQIPLARALLDATQPDGGEHDERICNLRGGCSDHE